MDIKTYIISVVLFSFLMSLCVFFAKRHEIKQKTPVDFNCGRTAVIPKVHNGRTVFGQIHKIKE